LLSLSPRPCGSVSFFFFTGDVVCGCHFCSALGAVLIVAGLYMVLWGKAREAQEKAAGVLPQDEEQGEESAAQDDAANAETK